MALNERGQRPWVSGCLRTSPSGVVDDGRATLAERGTSAAIEPLTEIAAQLLFGTFYSSRDAEALAQRITAHGYDAWVRDAYVYLVCLGPYPQASVDEIIGIIRIDAPDTLAEVVR